MANIERRVSALEKYVNELVEERMKQEVEAMLDLLEEHLTREEFIKVAGIVVEEDSYGA
jgi:hypothetical protein